MSPSAVETDPPAPVPNGVNGKKVAHATNGTNGADKPPAYQSHPLGPLTAKEISQSSALIKGQWPEGTLFQFKVVTLLEPAKAELIPYLSAEKSGQTPTDIDRRAFVVYYLKNTVSKPLLVWKSHVLIMLSRINSMRQLSISATML